MEKVNIVNYKHLVIMCWVFLLGWVGSACAGDWGDARTQTLNFTVLPEVFSALRWEPASGMHSDQLSSAGKVLGTFHISVSDDFSIGAHFDNEFIQPGQDALHGYAVSQDGQDKIRIYLSPEVNTVIKDDLTFPGGPGKVIVGPDGGTFSVKTDGKQKVMSGNYSSRVIFSTWYE